jgi:hypothetical protein
VCESCRICLPTGSCMPGKMCVWRADGGIPTCESCIGSMRK